MNNRGFTAGTVKIENFQGNNGLIKIHQNLGSWAIFHDFIKFLRVWPIFSGTQSLNGNLKENSLVE